MYEKECLKWFNEEWEVKLHQDLYIRAKRRKEFRYKLHSKTLFEVQDIAAIYMHSGIIVSEVGQKRLDQLLKWKVLDNTSQKQIAIFVDKSVGNDEIYNHLHGFDLLVYYPFINWTGAKGNQ